MEGAEYVATVGENRKLLVFSADEVNEMARGKGAALQGRQAGGCARVQLGLGLHLARLGGAHVHAVVGGAEGLGGRARAGRPHRAQGLPALQLLRPAF